MLYTPAHIVELVQLLHNSSKQMRNDRLKSRLLGKMFPENDKLKIHILANVSFLNVTKTVISIEQCTV